jgi:hypothetical protein
MAKLAEWAQVLGIPSDLRWFDPTPVSSGATVTPENTPLKQPSEADEAPSINRRELLIAPGTAAAAAGADLIANSPWQRLRESADNTRPVDASTIQLMEDRTAEYFETERTVPASQILDLLIKHRSIVSTLRDNARTEEARNRLAVVLGETDALRGWLYFDIGQGNEAATAWRSTLKIAKEAGDGPLAACALGYWSYLAESRNDVAPAAHRSRRSRHAHHHHLTGPSAG